MCDTKRIFFEMRGFTEKRQEIAEVSKCLPNRTVSVNSI